jgi:hypothetical protein
MRQLELQSRASASAIVGNGRVCLSAERPSVRYWGQRGRGALGHHHGAPDPRGEAEIDREIEALCSELFGVAPEMKIALRKLRETPTSIEDGT